MKGNNSRIRLLAAHLDDAGQPGGLFAGVQIELEPGWKTYWRSPGDAGGVPPELDWSNSKNIAATQLLFPAPSRLVDPSGDSIGYKHSVILPVGVLPSAANKPVNLDLNIIFGVCKNICIPEEHDLKLTYDPALPPGADDAALLKRALDSVPVDASKDAKAPQISGMSIDKSNAKAYLVIEATFPLGSKGADLFLEGVNGIYVPQPEKLAGNDDGHAVFRVDLSKSDDLKSPSGKELRLTLISGAGASQTVRAIP